MLRTHSVFIIWLWTLAGKFKEQLNLRENDNRLRNKLFMPPLYPVVQRVLRELDPVAASRGLTLAQLALSWVIANVSCVAIAGARSAEQVKMNALAAGHKMSQKEREEIKTLVKALHELLDADPMMWQH